jgi:hypothetical protein
MKPPSIWEILTAPLIIGVTWITLLLMLLVCVTVFVISWVWPTYPV